MSTPTPGKVRARTEQICESALSPVILGTHITGGRKGPCPPTQGITSGELPDLFVRSQGDVTFGKKSRGTRGSSGALVMFYALLWVVVSGYVPFMLIHQGFQSPNLMILLFIKGVAWYLTSWQHRNL